MLLSEVADLASKLTAIHVWAIPARSDLAPICRHAGKEYRQRIVKECTADRSTIVYDTGCLLLRGALVWRP